VGELEERALIGAALAGDREAIRRLTGRLRPVVHAEVAHLLLRRGPRHAAQARQEVEDLVQEVFARLWADNGERLRRWAPERGRSLDSWVRLVARSRALDLLRSRRQSPWQGEPTEPEALDRVPLADDAAQVGTVDARDSLERMQAWLRDRLSERDWQLFLSLFAEEIPVQQVCEEVGMTPAAVYQWKSRFVRNLLPEMVRELEGGGR
jgi:RNA polymerase sigma factor (sigma-70 family)